MIRTNLSFTVSLGLHELSGYSNSGVLLPEIINKAMNNDEDARSAIQYILWICFKQSVLDFEKSLK